LVATVDLVVAARVAAAYLAQQEPEDLGRLVKEMLAALGEPVVHPLAAAVAQQQLAAAAAPQVAGLGFRRPSQAQRLFTAAAELATLLGFLMAWVAWVAAAAWGCLELQTQAAVAAALHQMLLERRVVLEL
jgi:hypothetical protein